MGLSESDFNWLYTIYSIPNIILPFFGGYLCDKVRLLSGFGETMLDQPLPSSSWTRPTP